MTYADIGPNTPFAQVAKELGIQELHGVRGPIGPARCAKCGARNIPMGINVPDWDWYVDGHPVHNECRP